MQCFQSIDFQSIHSCGKPDWLRSGFFYVIFGCLQGFIKGFSVKPTRSENINMENLVWRVDAVQIGRSPLIYKLDQHFPQAFHSFTQDVYD